MKKKSKIYLVIVVLVVIVFIIYIVDKYVNKIKNGVVVTTNDTLGVDSISLINSKLSSQYSQIQTLQNYSTMRDIFEVVSASVDGQTVFYSTIMPQGYNKNRMKIELQNGDIVLSREDGYMFDTSTQKLTLNLPNFNLESGNEVRFCFY